jgi:hypothetical protein
MGACFFIGVEGLELDFLSLRLCLAPWLRDLDDLHALLVKLGHLAPINERGRQGQSSDDVNEAISEAEGLEALGLGDAEG